MIKEYCLIILGFLLILFGILDGIKYHWLASSIKKVKTGKGQSRKFINVALGKDLVMFGYSLLKGDSYLFFMTLIGFIFTIELMIVLYNYYPYKQRGLQHFKKPNFILYLINSMLPNRIRKHL